jgi:CBS-domain-containing membrane protein
VALRDGRSGDVGGIMRRDVTAVPMTAKLSDAQQQFASHRVRALPVAGDDGQLLGLLTAGDIGEAFRILSLQPSLTRQPAEPRPV